MSEFRRRLQAGMTALALALSCTVFFAGENVITAATPVFSSEAEKCTVTDGASVATAVYDKEYPGYSGDGFVWAGNSGGVSFEVTLKESAMYKLTSRCWMYLGDVGDKRLQNLAIDGETVGSLYVPNCNKWDDFSFGFFYLEAGKHTVELGSSGSWGFILYDTVTFDFADMPELDADSVPVDGKATAETKELMSYLSDNYGSKIISGQQEIYGNGNDGDYELEFEYLYEKTGKYPAIRGFDFMNYNPLYGWEDGTTGRMIQWVNQRGGIATVCWHINIPSEFTSYVPGEAVDWSVCTYKPVKTFNTANCLDPTTKEYEYLMLAIEDIAEQLLILQEAKVPVIFRPFHEAEGNNNTDGSGAWFWWGSGGADVYRELWKLLYTTLTEEYGIHNCIWEVNLYDYAESAKWYPGDEYVDIVAYDKYEGSPYQWKTDAATSMFLTLVGYTDDKKMVAMSENDIIPDVTSMTNEGAWWLYFCPWYGSCITDGIQNTPDMLDKIYNSEHVITLDEVPSDVYGFERGNNGVWDVEGAYECEDGKITANQGTKIIGNKYCSGSGYVYLQGEDDSIEQTVTVDKAGKYTLIYGYQQNFESTGKTQNLYINGESAGTAFFPYSILFGEAEPIVVDLKAGVNTIKIVSVEGWTYFDYLLVRAAEDIAQGDINADGAVNGTDLKLLGRHLLNASVLNSAQAQRADASGDKKVNAADMTVLKRMLLSDK